MLSETEFSSMYWYLWCVGVLVNVFLSFNPFGVFDKVLVVHVAASDMGTRKNRVREGDTRVAFPSRVSVGRPVLYRTPDRTHNFQALAAQTRYFTSGQRSIHQRSSSDSSNFDPI